LLLHRIAGGDCLTRRCFQTDDLDAVAARVVTHRVTPLGIAWVEIATDDRPRLDRYVAGVYADVRVVDGAPGLRRCAIDTAADEIIIA
jgi:hypothetical protein